MAGENSGDGDAGAPFPLDMDPEAFRAAGHHLVDRLAGYLGSLRDRRAGPDDEPAAVRALLGPAALPETGEDALRLLDHAAAVLFDHTRTNGHPRSWGFIIGSPAPLGMLAELLAAAVNANVVAWNSAPAPAEIERRVVAWIAELLGYPAGCGGILTSGGNMANLIGFLAARRAGADWDVRARGVAGDGAPRLRAYASAETHTWIHKAADLSGLGTDAVHWIETDAQQRMDVAALRAAIAADRARGERPFLIVASAGTVSTGAVDPLPALVDAARAEDLWLHVDGAYGAPAVALPDAPADLRGLREADSLAIDGHKWLFAPLEAGCVLVRDAAALRETFSYHPPYYHYYAHPGEAPINFHEYGPQNSRGFRALKLWLILRQAGRTAYVRMVARNVALARALAGVLRAEPDFEVFTCSLSITTFRYRPRDLAPGDPQAEAYLNRLNTALVERVQKDGAAYLSNAVLDGRFALRACITNFRSTLEDVRMLPGIVRRLGREVDGELREGAGKR